jgi:hypothetical protein
MPNLYKPSDIVAQSWQRSNKVTVENELDQVPVITFSEEEVVLIKGNKVVLNRVLLQENMGDPSKTFDLLNPETDEIIGSASYTQIYIMLYSLYKKLALDRDASIGV